MSSPSTEPRAPRPAAAPTVRQVYALAGALCERMGEEWPATRDEASELIERLRTENGHPQPRLEDCPPPQSRTRRRRRQPYPWWRHVRPKEVQIVVVGPDELREQLLGAARERLRAALAQEATALAEQGDEAAVGADVQAFLDQLKPEVNTT